MPAPESTAQPSAAELARLHQQIAADLETLRQQEQNLRHYEARLRGAPAPAVTSTPFAGQPEIDAERERLSRLRGLLEAERRALVDERLALREEKALVAQKIDELKQREAWLAVREREFQVRSFAPPPAAPKSGSGSPFGFRLGLNEVPFAEYCRGHRRSA